ncbi:MAG TPA: signal recognition particle protein [Dehalococcoidia bacterium]|nr:signal recognition particle protein [Dehalococcoidia bacterium]
MFESLTEKLGGIFGRLNSHGTVTEKDLDDAMREVRLALLEADVNYKVVREFIAKVREKALGAEILKSLTPTQQIVGIVNEELIELLGNEPGHINRAAQPPTIIMLVGLQGSGKTTHCAKLALHLRQRGDKPLLVAADVYRPAAIDQIQSLARQLDIPVYAEGTNVKPAQICRHALDEARRIGATVIIIDTAGRLHVDEAMMGEVAELRELLKPQEVLFVADAMAGQDAVRAAEEFHKAVGTTGLILSKMDGDARGGAVLSIRAVTGVGVKFVGVGEKADALETFYPDRMAQRILGMGDIQTLMERAQEAMGEQDVKDLERRMKTAQFDLQDFLTQMGKVKKMGRLADLVKMIPGVSRISNQLGVDQMDDDFFKRTEAIILSMTLFERRHPETLLKSKGSEKGSRKKRIAAGSGTSVAEVNQLLKQFEDARQMMKTLANSKGRGLLPGMFR